MKIPRVRSHLARPFLAFLTFAALGAAPTPLPAAPPVAAPDTYSSDQDTDLVVTTAQGLLANDTTHGQTVTTVLVDPPATGSLELNDDGSFRYSPAPGLFGPVTFAYKLLTIPGPVTFTIDQAQSRLQVEALASTEYGTATDRDDSRITGTLTARLTPSTAPFLTAHVTSLDARLVDDLSLSLRFGCLFGFCLATVNVTTRTTAPDWLTLAMVEPGPEAAVVNGVFSQFDNSFTLAGTADITGAGLAADLLPSGPQSLDTTATIDLANTQVAATATTLTLRAPVLYSGRFCLDPEVTTTNFIDLTARSAFTGSSGFLVATAPASANLPEESAIATVTLNILSDDLDEDGISDRWERLHGLDPTNPADATEDLDGDGADNRSEFLAGTNPRLATSVLAISAITSSGNSLTFTLTGLSPGLQYQLDSADTLAGWSPVGEPFTATTHTHSLHLTSPQALQFFLLRCLRTYP